MRLKNLCAVAALAIGLAAFTLAQEPAQAPETEQHDPWLKWKWANFAILAIGLAYVIRKNVPALFEKRSREIQQALSDAAKQKQDAETQAAAIEKRLAGLQTEIDNLRSAARADMTAENERISRNTEQRLRTIQEQSAQEIALMTRGIRDELRKYSAQVAIDLAEQRIRTRVTNDTQNALVDAFLRDVQVRRETGARI